MVPACVHVPEQPPDTASEVTATLVARAITRKSFAVTEDAKALLADVAVAVLLAEVCWLRLSAKTGWYTRSSEPASSPAIMSDFAWVRGLGPAARPEKNASHAQVLAMVQVMARVFPEARVSGPNVPSA